MKIDLHTHTTASDGTLTPKALIKEAIKQHMDVIAITDHDTIKGIPEALQEAKKQNIECIPGVEITIDDDKHQIYDIHLLGLFINHNNKDIINLLKESEKARELQKKEIVEKLQSLNYNITFEDLNKETQGAKGRPHIAKILVEKNPQIKDEREAFNTLIGNNQPGYVPRKIKISLQKAIQAIHKAGGIAAMAHLFLYDNPDKIIEAFAKEQGDALEVFYPYNKTRINKEENFSQKETIKKGLALAKKHNLKISGGSDFHGNHKDLVIGEINLPKEYFLTLKVTPSKV